jgi:hypothetical protein
LYGFIALLAVAVLFGLGVWLLPAGEQIAPPAPDLKPWALSERPIQADDVIQVKLPVALRGYRFAETDLLLDRLTDEIRLRDLELERLRAAPGRIEPASVGFEPASAGFEPASAGFEPASAEAQPAVPEQVRSWVPPDWDGPAGQRAAEWAPRAEPPAVGLRHPELDTTEPDTTEPDTTEPDTTDPNPPYAR